MSRHRHRKNPVDKTAAAERDARRRELAEKLATATGLSADDARIELASWSALALDIAKQQVLKGHLGDVAPWQRLVDQVGDLVPKSEVLNVRFVEGHICPKCQADTTIAAEAAKAAAAEAMATLEAEAPAPATPTPATPAPATNVTPLRQPPSIHGLPNAPLKRDEPWLLSIGSEFRRFDVPENF